MKNENGAGTVYKLKGKRRKPWVARITIGYEDGKQKRKVIGTFETKREAQQELILYAKNPNQYKDITFKEVKERWWAEYKETIKPTTYQSRRYLLQKLIVFDEYKIRDISLLQLQEYFQDGVGCQSAIKVMLNMIFKYAEKYDLIEKNRAQFIETKKGIRKITRNIFSTDEINSLWESKNIYAKLLLVLIYTGLRISEFLYLSDEDVDLENRIIYVRKSKTNKGIRTIPISQKILPLMQDVIDYDFKYQNCRLNLKKLFPNHTLHDTRHTFASLLNNANANSTTITKLIGHTDFNLTEKVYTHKDIQELRKAIDLLN